MTDVAEIAEPTRVARVYFDISHKPDMTAYALFDGEKWLEISAEQYAAHLKDKGTDHG